MQTRLTTVPIKPIIIKVEDEVKVEVVAGEDLAVAEEAEAAAEGIAPGGEIPILSITLIKSSSP